MPTDGAFNSRLIFPWSPSSRLHDFILITTHPLTSSYSPHTFPHTLTSSHLISTPHTSSPHTLTSSHLISTYPHLLTPHLHIPSPPHTSSPHTLTSSHLISDTHLTPHLLTPHLHTHTPSPHTHLTPHPYILFLFSLTPSYPILLPFPLHTTLPHPPLLLPSVALCAGT